MCVVYEFVGGWVGGWVCGGGGGGSDFVLHEGVCPATRTVVVVVGRGEGGEERGVCYVCVVACVVYAMRFQNVAKRHIDDIPQKKENISQHTANNRKHTTQ